MNLMFENEMSILSDEKKKNIFKKSQSI